MGTWGLKSSSADSTAWGFISSSANSTAWGLRSSSADSTADSILVLSLGAQPVSGQAWQMISNIMGTKILLSRLHCMGTKILLCRLHCMGTEILLCRLQCRLHPGPVSGGTPVSGQAWQMI